MFQKITRKHLESFLKQHRTESKVLDIGSGGSGYDRYFPNRLTADIDPERKPEVVADIQDMPFHNGEFEVILCTEVLEHVKNPFLAVQELERVLAPGGALILTTRFLFPIHDAPHDYFRYTKYGLRLLFSNWEIVELREETAGFATLAVLLQRFAFQMNLRFNRVTKVIVFALASVVSHLNVLVRDEFADIKKSAPENNIFASGYYLVAKKK